MKIALIMLLLVITAGCGSETIPSIGSTQQTRFVEQPSGGFNGYIYKDTKTGRLYIGTSTGGYTEVNEDILIEPK